SHRPPGLLCNGARRRVLQSSRSCKRTNPCASYRDRPARCLGGSRRVDREIRSDPQLCCDDRCAVLRPDGNGFVYLSKTRGAEVRRGFRACARPSLHNWRVCSGMLESCSQHLGGITIERRNRCRDSWDRRARVSVLGALTVATTKTARPPGKRDAIGRPSTPLHLL